MIGRAVITDAMGVRVHHVKQQIPHEMQVAFNDPEGIMMAYFDKLQRTMGEAVAAEMTISRYEDIKTFCTVLEGEAYIIPSLELAIANITKLILDAYSRGYADGLMPHSYPGPPTIEYKLYGEQARR